MDASNWKFVTAAYVITWALIIGYMVYSQRALQQARAEYERITGHRPGEGDTT